MKKISPIRIAIAYLLIAMVILYVKNQEPSIVGWALTFDTGIFIFAILLGFIDYFIGFIKNKIVWWVIQLVIFTLLIALFIYIGFQFKL